MNLVLILPLFAFIFRLTDAYPTGAPCDAYKPGHGESTIKPEEAANYQLVFDPPLGEGSQAEAWKTYTITLTGDPKGYLVEVDHGTMAPAVDKDVSTCWPKTCPGIANRMTHPRLDCQFKATWSAPQNGMVTFRYAAVQSFRKWVASMKSIAIVPPGSIKLPPKPEKSDKKADQDKKPTKVGEDCVDKWPQFCTNPVNLKVCDRYGAECKRFCNQC